VGKFLFRYCVLFWLVVPIGRPEVNLLRAKPGRPEVQSWISGDGCELKHWTLAKMSRLRYELKTFDRSRAPLAIGPYFDLHHPRLLRSHDFRRRPQRREVTERLRVDTVTSVVKVVLEASLR
jgi:hypothetical protein